MEILESERVISCFRGDRPDIAALWELCAYFEWPDRAKTVDEIAAWLGPAEGLSVLDLACGTGFPAIELAARGYDMTCSDGSALMLEHFRANATREGVALKGEVVLWQELESFYQRTFDVVMCRGGGSYLYAGTWDSDGEPDRAALSGAIQQFAAMVRPGGRLYVDIMDADTLARRESDHTEYPPMRVGDRTVELKETITNDFETRTRIWNSTLVVDGVAHEFRRHSHNIDHGELVSMLTGAGLVDVRPESMPSERYQVFTARRPDQ
jgi:SAM-dependent methyltransferase